MSVALHPGEFILLVVQFSWRGRLGLSNKMAAVVTSPPPPPPREVAIGCSISIFHARKNRAWTSVDVDHVLYLFVSWDFLFQTRRRHHCRCCGRVFCHVCTTQSVPYVAEYLLECPVCSRTFVRVSRMKPTVCWSQSCRLPSLLFRIL